MVSPLGPVPVTNEQSNVKQNIGIQQLFKAINFLSPLIIGGTYTGVNLNSANTDYPITMATVAPQYFVHRVIVRNYGTTASITTATAGLFTAAAAGGTALCADQSLAGLTTNLVNTAGGLMQLTFGSGSRMWINAATLYFRVGTAQGAAATADVYVYIQPLP